MTRKERRKHIAKVEQAKQRLAHGTTTSSQTPTKMLRGIKSETHTSWTNTDRFCRKLSICASPTIYAVSKGGQMQFMQRRIDGYRNMID